MAHGGPAEQDKRLAAIRRVSQELGPADRRAGRSVGSENSPGRAAGRHDRVRGGEEFRFVRGAQPQQPRDLTTTYAPLVDELAVGDNVMLADGTVSMVVFEKTSDFARARVVQPGVIRSRQGLNLPGVKLSAPAMDEADRDERRVGRGQRDRLCRA